MKKNKELVKLMAIAILLTLFGSNAYSQKREKIVSDYKVVESSKKNAPRWVDKWDFGSSFKVTRSKKGVENGLKFMFKAEEILRKDPPYSKSMVDARARAKANGQLAQAIASVYEEQIKINDEVYQTMDEDKKTEVTTNLADFRSKSKISGFVEVASYWELLQDKNTGEKYWSVYKLFSIDAKRVRDVIEKMNEKLALPDLIESAATERLQTPDDDDDILGF